VPSLKEALSNPAMLRRLEAFDDYPDAVQPPDVLTEERTIPGPHDPVPVRIYFPDATVA